MATLQRSVTSGFRPQDRKAVTFAPVKRRVEIDDVSKRVEQLDATVTFSIRDGSGKHAADWQHVAQDVGFDFDWYDAAFRAAAWDAYKAAKGFVEI